MKLKKSTSTTDGEHTHHDFKRKVRKVRKEYEEKDFKEALEELSVPRYRDNDPEQGTPV